MAYIASDSAFTTGSGVSVDTFTDGPDYTAGTSSQVTLSEFPASENSVWVFFNGIAQHHSEYSINGNVVSFTSVIPSNVSTIEVQNNLQLAVGVPGHGTVGYNTLTDNAITTLLRKNAIINGNFDIWQRGTSQSTAGYGAADRWASYFTGTSVTHSVSRQAFALGQTAVPNEPEWFARNAFVSGSDVATEVQFYQGIEDIRSFAGDAVTISFWAQCGTSLDMSIEIDQYFGGSGSPSTRVRSAQNITLTPSWKQYALTFNIPSISGKTLGTDGTDALYFAFFGSAGSNLDSRTNSLGLQSGTIDIAQVQVEKGITTTDFERRSIGEELALCQRYYWLRDASESNNERLAAGGNVISATSTQVALPLPVTMRAVPVLTHGTVSSMGVYDGTVSQTVTVIGTAEASRELYNLSITTSGTLTVGRPAQFTRSGSASNAWVAFDAEIG